MRQTPTLNAYPRIWRVVARIPRGKVASYGTVSRPAGYPTQPRMAGYALHRLPDGLDLPWHRVLNSRGKISLRGEAATEQQRRLKEEGIEFSRGRVDMRRYGWMNRKR
jgi:methylated-DNA-protein-cysteine methyltransferase-like protein